MDWRAVEEQFQSWDFKSQGLTEAGAALVTLLAAVVTGPATGIASNMSGAASGALGLAGNASMEAAISAGVRSLISKSAVALANNKGDIGGALKELGSSANLRSLATSMVSAGLVTNIVADLKIPEVSPEATLAANMSAAAKRGVEEAAVRLSAETTIGGGNIEDALKISLKAAAADAIGSVVAGLAGGLASAIVSGKVDSGASAGRNAVEHNFLCGGLCIAAGVFVVGSVYVAIVGKGDVGEGLALFGEGEACSRNDWR